MKIKTHIKAGALTTNHNQTLVRPQPQSFLKVKTSVRAGGAAFPNHNQTLLRPQLGRSLKPSLKVKTSIKAGALTTNHNQTLVRNRRS